MIPADLYCIHGHGGRVTSGGMDDMARAVEAWKMPGVRVQVFDWRQWREIVADINAYAPFDRYRQIVGYSIGANAADWVLCGLDYQGEQYNGIHGCQVDYGVFIDPTWLSPLSPLTSKTLKRGHWYCNRSIDLVGHAAMSLDADFDRENFKVTTTYSSHLILDFDPAIQRDVLNHFHEAVIDKTASNARWKNERGQG